MSSSTKDRCFSARCRVGGGEVDQIAVVADGFLEFEPFGVGFPGEMNSADKRRGFPLLLFLVKTWTVSMQAFRLARRALCMPPAMERWEPNIYVRFSRVLN